MMRCFKFMIGPELISIPSDPRFQAANCGAIVIAPDAETARNLLRSDLIAHGDVPWSDVATVTEISLDTLGVAFVAQLP